MRLTQCCSCHNLNTFWHIAIFRHWLWDYFNTVQIFYMMNTYMNYLCSCIGRPLKWTLSYCCCSMQFLSFLFTGCVLLWPWALLSIRVHLWRTWPEMCPKWWWINWMDKETKSCSFEKSKWLHMVFLAISTGIHLSTSFLVRLEVDVWP